MEFYEFFQILIVMVDKIEVWICIYYFFCIVDKEDDLMLVKLNQEVKMYWMRFNKNIFYICKINNMLLRCRILNSIGLLLKSVKLVKYYIVVWYKR